MPMGDAPAGITDHPGDHDHANSFSTADIFDAAPDRVTMIDAPLLHFGGRRRFRGACATLVAHGDAQAIGDAVRLAGEGRVLVIDGRDLPDLACLGEIMVQRMVDAGWAGAIVFGALRDSHAIAQLPIGVMALRTTAKRPFVEGVGVAGTTIDVAGLSIAPGMTIVADEDAVLVLTPDG
jgi:regulator of ribonuclease activity A